MLFPILVGHMVYLPLCVEGLDRSLVPRWIQVGRCVGGGRPESSAVTTATCEHRPPQSPPLAAAEPQVLPLTQGLLGRLLHWALNVEQQQGSAAEWDSSCKFYSAGGECR
jgi:hypothetical protein